MILKITKCTHCPKMPDCEHRAIIKSEARKALTGITVNYNCKVYDSVFQKHDEVLVQVYEYKPENVGRKNRYGKVDKLFRGVVIGVPTRGKKYGIAFLDEVKICDGEQDTAYETLEPTYRILQYGKVFPDQLTFVKKYEGEKFWREQSIFDRYGNQLA